MRFVIDLDNTIIDNTLKAATKFLTQCFGIKTTAEETTSKPPTETDRQKNIADNEPYRILDQRTLH